MTLEAFEETYRAYLARIAEVDLEARAGKLGARMMGGAAVIPLLGREHRVSASGIEDPAGGRPIHAVSVVLARYVLSCPEAAPGGGPEWVAYRDFPDAAPFVGGFETNAQRPIARRFRGRTDELREAVRALGGGRCPVEVSASLAAGLRALPRVDLGLVFNDEDEEFPAQATILFDRRSACYLDPECLAIVGWLLADRLDEEAGGSHGTIM